jgi:hypothetical protein
VAWVAFFSGGCYISNIHIFFVGVEKLVICSNVGMNCINGVEKESCHLCRKTLDTWIKTSIHLDGTDEPVILCVDCAKKIIKDIDKNSTEYETRELLLDVREYQEKSVSTNVIKILAFLLVCFFFVSLFYD